MTTPAPRSSRPVRLLLVGAAPVVSVLVLGACTAGTTDEGASTSPTVAASDVPGGTQPAATSTSEAADGTPGLEATAGSTEESDPGGTSLTGGPTGVRPTAPEAEVELVPPDVRSTAGRSVAPPDDVISLVDVVTDETAGAETITFATSGGVPGYRVQYVDAVRVEGEPVLVEGDAFLEVVLESADPDGQEGLSEDVAVALLVEQELIREVRFARYVDGVVTYAVGLSAQAEYTVSQDNTGLTLTFPR